MSESGGLDFQFKPNINHTKFKNYQILFLQTKNASNWESAERVCS
jgi:hypothetical protein